MKKYFLILFFSMSIFATMLFSSSPEKTKRYYKMNLEEIDQDIRFVAQTNWNSGRKMQYYSERFLAAPYALQCEGDGAYAKYETWPLLNFKQLNCMTYCEIVLALTLADYYEEMFNILQHIRYRQGIIGMATRNHYTMADWLPANAWCLEDVSRRMGGDDTAQLTRTISHRTFFKKKGIQDLPIRLPDREVTIDYIPLSKLTRHESESVSGDIVALIQDRPSIFSAHMLMIIRKENQTFFRHASMSAGKVIDSPFKAYIKQLATKPRYLGMSFMRVRTDIQWHDSTATHGKFFLP